MATGSARWSIRSDISGTSPRMSRMSRPRRSAAAPPRWAGGRSRKATSHDPARAHALFGDCRPPAAQLAGWREARRLDHRQSRILGYLAADGAAGIAGADRTGALARRAELVLARIRHAGRGVAVFRVVPAAANPPDIVDQRPGLRGLRAGRARRARGWLG